MWLVPFTFFVSLSANDLTLPQTGGGAPGITRLDSEDASLPGSAARSGKRGGSALRCMLRLVSARTQSFSLPRPLGGCSAPGVLQGPAGRPGPENQQVLLKACCSIIMVVALFADEQHRDGVG